MALFKKRSICYVSIFLIFFLSALSVNATELRGIITGIKGDKIYIDLVSNSLPQKGDGVTILLEIDGESYEAGTAEVIDVKKIGVIAKVIDGTPSIDMKIVIQTAGQTAQDSSPLQGQNTPPLHRCDKLAGDPYDNKRIGPAVNFNAISTDQAVTACKKALISYPDTVRFQYQLGRSYNADRQFEKAVLYYRKAAAKGMVRAQADLGVMYYFGNGFSKNYEEARQWFLKSGGQGDVIAQYLLGNIYYDGLVGSRDRSKAEKWYRKAAIQGFASAQNNLASMYYSGRGGLPLDYKKAAKWYRKAANQGQANAQDNMGVMYEYGRGVPQNYKMALNWYHKSASQNHAEAQYHLGKIYETGRGVQQNLKEAIKWFKKAAVQGNKKAKEALTLLK